MEPLSKEQKENLHRLYHQSRQGKDEPEIFDRLEGNQWFRYRRTENGEYDRSVLVIDAQS